MAKGKYQEWLEPEGLTLLKEWARHGLSEEQIAHNIGINKATLYDWIKRYPDISDSLKNGKQILFAGLDDVEKVKSITPQNGVLERIFVEEATEIKREAYKQLTKRLRGYSKYSKHVILAFNPILKPQRGCL